MALFNINLHPSFFQQNIPPLDEPRTIESVDFSRSIHVDFDRMTRPYKRYKETFKAPIRKEAVRGVYNEDLVNRSYFSQKNIDELQKILRYKVWERSGHIVGRQDETDLLIIMRSIYLQNSNNPVTCDPVEIQKEIDRVNSFVVRDAVPRIIERVERYYGYLRDASQLPEEMARSISTSNTGTRELRSVTNVLTGGR